MNIYHIFHINSVFVRAWDCYGNNLRYHGNVILSQSQFFKKFKVKINKHL